MSYLQTIREVGVPSLALRLGYEAQRRSGVLRFRMLARSGWSHWALPGILGREFHERWQERLTASRRTFFSDKSTQARVRELLSDEGKQSLVSNANRILQGELPFFGKLWMKTGFPPAWFVSARDGVKIEPDRPWTAMGFYGADFGDLKFILEPSRFLFVGELARAYLLTGDERYPSAFWQSIEDWAHSSPPMSGPLWICGQESALRIVSWCLGWMAFRDARSTTLDRQAKLLSMIAAHGWRIAQTRSYSRSQRTNHVISEATGLLTASLVFPELRWSSTWRKFALTDLQTAVQDQFLPDGTYAQQSLNYQRMSLQMLAWAVSLLNLYEEPVPGIIYERMLAARDFLLAIMDPGTGCVPNIGANDGTLALPLDTCQYEDFRPTTQLVSRAVRCDSGLPAGAWDEPGIWLFGCEAAPDKQKKGATSGNTYRGFYLARNAESRVVLRCEEGTRRPYHADQLHLDIWWKGLNLARDPGTFMYNGQPPWNNGLASSAAHNTVLVDEVDQMERAGRFLWRRWAHGSILGHHANSIRAEHDGYSRVGVIHHRSVADLAGRGWVVVDDLIGQGRHKASLHWLLPDVPFEARESSPFEILLRSPIGEATVIGISSVPAKGYLVRCGVRQAQSSEDVPFSDRLRGWEASTYGLLQSALSLVLETAAELPLRFCSLFLFSAHENFSAELDSSVKLRIADCDFVIKIPSVGKKAIISVESVTAGREL